MEKDLVRSDPALAAVFAFFTALADHERVPGKSRLTAQSAQMPTSAVPSDVKAGQRPRSRPSGLNHRMARSRSVRAQLARGATGQQSRL
jgi:hypothetical protein